MSHLALLMWAVLFRASLATHDCQLISIGHVNNFHSSGFHDHVAWDDVDKDDFKPSIKLLLLLLLHLICPLLAKRHQESFGSISGLFLCRILLLWCTHFWLSSSCWVYFLLGFLIKFSDLAFNNFWIWLEKCFLAQLSVDICQLM